MHLKTRQRGAKSFLVYEVHEWDAKLRKPQVFSDLRINMWQSKIYKQNKNMFWQKFKNLQKEGIQVSLVIRWHINNLLHEIDVNIFAIFAKKIRSIEQLFGSTGREKSCSPHLMGPNCQIVPISTHYQKGNTLENENWVIISALSKYKLSVLIKAEGEGGSF